jgi:hypothetical protein
MEALSGHVLEDPTVHFAQVCRVELSAYRVERKLNNPVARYVGFNLLAVCGRGSTSRPG